MEQFVGVKGSPDEYGKKGTEIKNEKCQACIYFTVYHTQTQRKNPRVGA